MSQDFTTTRDRLFLPILAPFYNSFAQPVGWLLFRIVIGGLLVDSGWDKIQNPMGMVGFVDSLGFGMGWLFSPLIAIANFVGGLMIVFGLFTRPAALANTVMLLVAYWFHVTNPFGDAFLTQAGIEYVNANPDLLTAAGQRFLLADGGVGMLNGPTGFQLAAEHKALFWAAGAAIIAALGGGRLSIDRMMRREF